MSSSIVALAFQGLAIVVALLGCGLTANAGFEVIHDETPLVVNDKQTTWLQTFGFISLPLGVCGFVAIGLLRSARKIKKEAPQKMR